MPANAKTSTSDIRAKSLAGGHDVTWRFSARTNNPPASAIRINGNNLATVTTVLSRTPDRTPRRLITTQKVYAATRIAACITGPDSAGISSPMLDAITDDTAAVANVPSINS